MIEIKDLHKYIGKEVFIAGRSSKPNKVLMRSFSVFMEDGEAKAEIKVSSLDPQKSFYSVTVGNDELFVAEELL